METLRKQTDQGGLIQPRPREFAHNMARAIQCITDQMDLLNRLSLRQKEYTKIIISDACKKYKVQEKSVKMIIEGASR